MANYELLPNNMRGFNLHRDGFVYQVSGRTARKTYWKCAKFKGGCPSRLTTRTDDGVMTITNEIHNHEAIPQLAETTRAYQAMKERARTSDESTHRIYMGGLASCAVEARTFLPKKNTIKRTLRRQR